MKNTILKKGIAIVGIMLIAYLSIFKVNDMVQNSKYLEGTVQTLENKKEDVQKLMLVTAGASTTISLLPGDFGTPIAEKFADLSFYMIIILTAIYLQKWLVAISGILLFKYMIPVACLVLIMYLLEFENEILKKIVIKLIVMSISVFLVVPLSSDLTSVIDKQTEVSIEQTTKKADAVRESIENKNKEANGDSNVLMKLINSLSSGLKLYSVKLDEIFKNTCDLLAKMIFSSCVVPILVLLLLVKIFNYLFGANYVVPNISMVHKFRKKEIESFDVEDVDNDVKMNKEKES